MLQFLKDIKIIITLKSNFIMKINNVFACAIHTIYFKK